MKHFYTGINKMNRVLDDLIKRQFLLREQLKEINAIIKEELEKDTKQMVLDVSVKQSPTKVA